jgi:hypothetical protein
LHNSSWNRYDGKNNDFLENSSKDKMEKRTWLKKRKSWQIGAIIGGAVGVIGTAITVITGTLSTISLLLWLLFARSGLGMFGALFFYPHCELFISVLVYAIFGGITGHIYDRIRERWTK